MNKLISFFCCIISILFFIKCSSAELKIVPESRVMEIRHGYRYDFGVREDNTTNITRCYYESNNGISGYFDVVDKWYRSHNTEKNSRLFEPREEWEMNEVSNSGYIGYCEVNVRWASNEGPTRWVLTPFNNQTNGHVGNLSSITYTVNFYNNVSSLASTIRVHEGASFINYLSYPQKPQNITVCAVSFKNTTVELDMHSNAKISSNATSPEEKEIVDKLSSLGHGLCGFKYTNVSNAIQNLEWTMKATEYNNTFYRIKFGSYIHALSLYNRKEVQLGDKFYIPCAYGYDANFCDLYNPSGKLVPTKGCGYDGQFATMEDIGRWKCYVGDALSMEATPVIIELVEKVVENEVITWVNETNNHVNLGCRLNVNYNIACKITKPNLQGLNLGPYTVTDRYSTVGTNLNKSICSMQIKKPLQKDEYGSWQCEINLGKSSIGKFIDLNKTENIEYPNQLKVVTQLKEQFTVSCRVPYSSEFCDIIPPNSYERYPNTTIYEPQLGRCSITMLQAQWSHVGNWTCLFAQKQGVPQDEIKVEVIVSGWLTYNKEVTGQLGGVTNILCHTNGMPLKHCQFTNPIGETYYIHNHENSTNLSYYGKGIEYGDCGVSIMSTTAKDLGKWICTVTAISKFGPQEGIINVT